MMPLRHHYFKGDVAWTEDGHRYAWRMMLRSKSGYGSFTVVNLQSGARIKIDPSDYLSKRQRRKLFTHPDMILQFAHFLEAEYHRQGWKEIAVYADIQVKLNHHNFQQYTDPEIDLTQKNWSFWKESDWIMQLK